MSNKDLVHRFVRLWNEGRTDRLGEVTHETFTWHSIEGRTIAGLSEYVTSVTNKSQGKRNIRVEETLTEGDMVMFRLAMDRGDGAVFHTHDLFRISDGKIAEEWSGHA
ncbi:nuclear transport factor 2 family protein [Streptomyces sp. NPDC002205]|uniref:nuclear transport factor 2 family protein n=1 Tax=Streptomyces sp. NPDC002205 TaxID=3154411 RepID=UPI00332DA397